VVFHDYLCFGAAALREETMNPTQAWKKSGRFFYYFENQILLLSSLISGREVVKSKTADVRFRLDVMTCGQVGQWPLWANGQINEMILQKTQILRWQLHYTDALTNTQWGSLSLESTTSQSS